MHCALIPMKTGTLHWLLLLLMVPGTWCDMV